MSQFRISNVDSSGNTSESVTQLYSPPTTYPITAENRETSILGKGIGSLNYGSKGSKKPRCLLACSGSVATVKVPELAVRLSEYFEVLIVCTNNAMFFLQRAEAYNPTMWYQFLNIGGMDLVLEDKDEWEMWSKIGHDILHIDLRRWADVLVVAPASANLIAKASVGICDNLLLSLLRAWELKKRPCLLCPAMNTVMWEHPSTQPALTTLQSWGWKIVGPVEKMLACKEVGSGAMAYVDDIVHATRRALEPIHNIAPYLADEDERAADLKEFPPNKSNIPHQIWMENFQTQMSEDVARTVVQQRQLQQEIEKSNIRHSRAEERLNKLVLTFKMVAVPALLLIWGTMQQIKKSST